MNAQQGNYEVVSIIKREIRLRNRLTLVSLGNCCIIELFCLLIERCPISLVMFFCLDAKGTKKSRPEKPLLKMAYFFLNQLNSLYVLLA